MPILTYPGGYESRPEGPYDNVVADAHTPREKHIGRIRTHYNPETQRHTAEPDFMGKPLGRFASLEAGAMAVIAAYEALGGCHGIEREAEFDTPTPFAAQCAQVLRASSLDEIAGHLESAVRHGARHLGEGEARVMARTARGLRDLVRMAADEPSAHPADLARGDFDPEGRWSAADEALYQQLFG